MPTVPPDVRGLLGAVAAPVDRPYVVLAYAQSVDGRLATFDGDGGTESQQRLSHALRAGCDAVLVGAGTVDRDDPSLTVRQVAGASPLRVVLDAELKVAPTAQVFDDEAATTVFTVAPADSLRAAELRAAGVGVREVASGPGGVDIAAVLAELRRSGVHSVLVEGGASRHRRHARSRPGGPARGRGDAAGRRLAADRGLGRPAAADQPVRLPRRRGRAGQLGRRSGHEPGLMAYPVFE